MPANEDVSPDLSFGRHPVYGIVAADPRLAASTWVLRGFDFHPMPGQPTLYALAEQEHDAARRTTRAVELLRRSGYRVGVDPTLAPSLATEAGPALVRAPFGAPDVAFAEHPQFGIIAAVDDQASDRAALALVENGWGLHPSLDVYTLPGTTSREKALEKVANVTLDAQRSGLQVAVQPRLAQDVAAHHRPAPVPPEPRERRQRALRSSSVSAAALAGSPAQAGLPDKAPVVSPTAAVRPVDPRVAFSRDR
ncbi:hypothetical protein ACF05R_00895 [Streptomyces albidoflavus]